MSFLLTPRHALALTLLLPLLVPHARAQRTAARDAQIARMLVDNGYKVGGEKAAALKGRSVTPPANPDDEKKADQAAAAAKNAAASLEQQLTGFGFGAGMAVLYTSGGRPVESAQVDSGNVVRIESKSKMRAGAIFETHWLWDELPFVNPGKKEQEDGEAPKNFRTAVETVLNLRQTENYDERGVRRAGVTVPQALRRHVSMGPMFTAEMGDNTLRSVGAGLMLAFQHYSVNGDGAVERRGMPFNVGLIGFAEPNVKHVKGGFVDGQVVPAGTTLHLEEEHRFGFGLVFSSRF